MKTKQRDLRDFVMAEYGIADREYIMETVSAEKRLDTIRTLLGLLSKERTTLTIHPNCEAYAYFINEFRNKLTFEHENIIVPNTEIAITRKLKKN